MNHREVLGVSQSAGAKEIKQAFRKAAKQYHPDHNNSPEAAKTFARIKNAHDALLKEVESRRTPVASKAPSAHTGPTTSRTVYSAPQPPKMTAEELAHTQDLDEKVRQTPKKSLFNIVKESAELRRHRKKIKTNERRLRGLY